MAKEPKDSAFRGLTPQRAWLLLRKMQIMRAQGGLLSREELAEAMDKAEPKIREEMESLRRRLKERVVTMIESDFMRAAEQGDAAKVQAFLAAGFPVNYQDPRTKETALHASAGSRARSTLKALLATGECDFLLRDRRGRLASEVAYVDGQDPAAARLLEIKERKQAEAQNIILTHRPTPSGA